MFMAKWKVLIDNHEKKYKTWHQKFPAILCKGHQVTMKFC